MKYYSRQLAIRDRNRTGEQLGRVEESDILEEEVEEEELSRRVKNGCYGYRRAVRLRENKKKAAIFFQSTPSCHYKLTFRHEK